MKVHAIQTGLVRIKTAQVEGRGHGLSRRLAIFTDGTWTEWLPTYAWVIDHPEGIIVVDTGQGAHLLDGRLRGYLPHRWPKWFDPKPLNLAAESFGPFAASRRLTQAGDVIAVATPGHTVDHLSVVVQDDDTAYFLAGDTSYNEELMLQGRLDGVSADEQVCGATLDAIRRFSQSRPTV